MAVSGHVQQTNWIKIAEIVVQIPRYSTRYNIALEILEIGPRISGTFFIQFYAAQRKKLSPSLMDIRLTSQSLGDKVS